MVESKHLGLFTCDIEDSVVRGQRAVLPALTLPVDHDLHDICSHRDFGGVEGHTGGGAVTRLKVLTWERQRNQTDLTCILSLHLTVYIAEL